MSYHLHVESRKMNLFAEQKRSHRLETKFTVTKREWDELGDKIDI